jgi:hypothetical protein
VIADRQFEQPVARHKKPAFSQPAFDVSELAFRTTKSRSWRAKFYRRRAPQDNQ